MTPSAESLNELYALLHALSEQEMTPAQLARLEELVLGDPDLRQRYLIYCQWHAAVERYGLPAGGASLADALAADEQECRACGGESMPDGAGDETAAPPRLPLLPSWLPDSPAGGLTMLAIGALLLTAAVLAGGLGIKALRPSEKTQQIAAAPGREAALAERGLGEAIATLVDSADCDWSQSPARLPESARLPSGWLLLSSGVAAIEFDCGATVLLQGPAEFALNSAECGTLRSGRLVSKAKAPNSGFTILTGNTEIVDQGTEFGVFADNSGSTEVHVFDGIAKVRQRGVMHGAIPERFLKAGQATRFEAKLPDPAGEPVNRLDGPVGIAFGPDGALYVASRFTDSILRYDGRTGSLIDTFVPSRAGDLNNPFFLTFGPDGQLYVSSTGNHSVLRFDGQSGAFLDAFVPPRTGGIAGPMGLAFGPDGNLYVASNGKQTVCRFDGRSGAPLGYFFESGSGGLNGPTGITFAPNGDLWVADRNRDCVLRYDGASGEFRERLTLNERLKFPFDVAFNPAGTLYVASHSNHQIVQYDPVTRAISGGIDARQAPSWPHALAFGADGRLYCTSDSANAVMRYEGDSGEFVDAFVVSWQDLRANRGNFVLKMPDRVVCNTGISRAGNPMRPGEHCPRWFIEKSPDPRFIPPGPAVVTDAISGWLPNDERSSWLSIAPLREDYRAAAGSYVFYAGFEVNAQDLEHARLVGIARTPQKLVDVQINKQPAPVRIEQHADGQSVEFVIDRGLEVGLNFVSFIVDNEDEGPVAFRAEVSLIRGREAGDE